MRPTHEGSRTGRTSGHPVAVADADRPRVAAYPDGARLARRSIDDHELVWVLRGRAELRAATRAAAPGDANPTPAPAGGPVPLRPGDLLLLPPGVGHEFVWRGSGGCVHGYVHARLQPGGPLEGLRTAVRAQASDDDPTAGLCRYLLWLGSHEPDGWHRRVASTVEVLLDLLLTGPLPGSAAGDEAWPAPVEAALARLRERWGAGPPLPAVRVTDLAAAVHVSPTYLARVVRRACGRPVSTLLEQLRVTRVEALLRGTSSTLDVIARECGFADAFHCSRRFTLHHGLPPSRYRAAATVPSLLDDAVVRRAARTVWGW